MPRAASRWRSRAARRFLEAAEVDPSRNQELRRRAAERFFINGDLDEGTEAMRRAPGAAGFDYDALVRRKAARPAYQALLERGFEFERRDPASMDAVQRARLDTLHAASVGVLALLPGAALQICCGPRSCFRPPRTVRRYSSVSSETPPSPVASPLRLRHARRLPLPARHGRAGAR